jgi:hypothetical protein
VHKVRIMPIWRPLLLLLLLRVCVVRGVNAGDDAVVGAGALWTHFEQSGQPEALETAVAMHREAPELRAESYPRRPNSLSNLALTPWTRFEQLGQYEDLEAAVSLHQEALELRPAPHPDRSTSLDNLHRPINTV